MTENPLPADFAADSAPQGAAPPIIRVSDVSFTYDGETLALSGASVRLARRVRMRPRRQRVGEIHAR